MNKNVVYLLALLAGTAGHLVAQETDELPIPTLENMSMLPTKQPSKNAKKKLIAFDFENEDLTKIIDELARLQKTNIILPYGANTINQKITFKLGRKITLEEADRYVDTFLDLAGYSKVPHGDFYMIVKNEVRGDKNIANLEPLPLYVSIPPEELPDTGRIRVVYYFRNLKVPTVDKGNDPLHTILNDQLSSTQSYTFDAKSNGIIIADKATNIKAVMSMLLELDGLGVRDNIRQLRIFNTSATVVADLLQKQMVAVTGTEQGRLRSEAKSEAGLYFTPGTKIIADPRTNSIIIMGKEPAIERIVQFVQEYIDVPLESGKSILHYKDLQFLDAQEFAPILTKIVSGPSAEAGQATLQDAGGPNRFFEGVIIVAETQSQEKPAEVRTAEPIKARKTEYGTVGTLKGTVFKGGNRIIVAAKNQDWKRIEKLIQDLDKPQMQVVIQVMIIDLDVSENKIFGMQTRNPSMFNLPKGFSFQTTHLITPAIGSQATPPAATLATDLLQLLTGTPPVSAAKILSTPVDSQGSLILSLNDPNGTGIWTFLQWLQAFGEVKVLSHPYLVALNNHEAKEVISLIKRVNGDIVPGDGGVLSRKQEDLEAALKVNVVPRASSVDRVNLQLSISINDFLADTSINIATRELHTNVNMGTGQMLVLGGLTRSQDTETDYETPLLGKIPVIRWLFSKNQLTTRKTNLSVFIIPTIVEPKIRAGMNRYTKDKIDDSYSGIETDALFSQLRDPVTYLFLSDAEVTSVSMVEEYLSESKGDFVRRTGPTKNRRQSCDAPKKAITAESQQLQEKLAAEGNPLLTTN